uniref:AAA_12 domain-containing protein n=1 Tax=Macrostomum lignano TaxID=282301 RepID=A0A1I8FRJ5_9PLAT
RLDASQRAALAVVLSSKPDPGLLFIGGPPGTGKSAGRQHRLPGGGGGGGGGGIVFCRFSSAPSPTPLSTVWLDGCASPLRAYCCSACHRLASSLPTSARDDDSLNDSQTMQQRLLRSADVILALSTSIGGLYDVRFSLALIDDANESPERVVLLGTDHRLAVAAATTSNALALTVQHRMRPELASLPSRCSAWPALEMPAPPPTLPPPMVFSAVCFINCDEGSAASSIELIDRVLAVLLETESLEAIAVLTLSGASDRVGQSLHLRDVQVASVDEFRGLETDFVIYANSLLSDAEQSDFEVLFTRARRCIVVIGDRVAMETSSNIWCNWLSQAEEISECQLWNQSNGARKQLSQGGKHQKTEEANHLLAAAVIKEADNLLARRRSKRMAICSRRQRSERMAICSQRRGSERNGNLLAAAEIRENGKSARGGRDQRGGNCFSLAICSRVEIKERQSCSRDGECSKSSQTKQGMPGRVSFSQQDDVRDHAAGYAALVQRQLQRSSKRCSQQRQQQSAPCAGYPCSELNSLLGYPSLTLSRVDEAPNRPALIDVSARTENDDGGSHRVLTLADVRDLSLNAAGGLARHGIVDGAVLALFLHNCPETSTSLTSLCPVRITLTSCWSTPTVARSLDDWQLDPSKRVAILPYSSGTTGLPKGVQLSHIQSHSATARHVRPVSGVLPFYHIYGQAMVGQALHTGCATVLMRKFEPETFLRAVEEHGINVMHLVPPLVLFLLQHPLSGAIYSAAAPLGPEIQLRLVDMFKTRYGVDIELQQLYGLTETSPITHGPQPLGERPASTLGQIGAPVCATSSPGSSTSLRGQDVGPGQEGELVVKGPAGRWFHTGDIAVYDEFGYFKIVDRVKELIKVKGSQVAPAELEDILLNHPSVQDCAIIGRPDERAGELPCAFVVPRPGVQTDCEEVKSYVADRVTKYKRLDGGVVFTDSIPRNPSGKILRRFLRDSTALTNCHGHCELEAVFSIILRASREQINQFFYNFSG